jgi:hypothetical protein
MTTQQATPIPEANHVPTHDEIAALWAPLRVALIARDGREGAAEWLTFAAGVLKADAKHAVAIAERRAKLLPGALADAREAHARAQRGGNAGFDRATLDGAFK